MNVLLVGSGGREHALAWKLAQSPLLKRLYVAPGNAGTAILDQQFPQVKVSNLEIKATDVPGIAAFAGQNAIDLVVVGPEEPLALGLTDQLKMGGLRVFGPTRAAAQIEASKAFAKDFLARHKIPSAGFATFRRYEDALAYLNTLPGDPPPVVIKASGLAAGKGVVVPQSRQQAEAALQQIMLEKAFGVAGDEVVLEERLEGPEISLLAFCDGKLARPMIPAQDHKRILEGDQGANTGGMGAYAPVPICAPEMAAELTRTVLQPVVDGLRAEGRPFVGALYAGLMLTDTGPQVIEFNCRFGDPETQVILPLLDGDLLEIFLACAGGSLADADIRWKPGAAACVVLASRGYPGKYPTGYEIRGVKANRTDAYIFHAGTKLHHDGKILTAGGRVLCVSGWGESIKTALANAYKAIDGVSFEGMQYRKDIGWRVFHEHNK
ncbi:MAG: phosphoribosylamine--glycine ligase [Chloroflexota bacterium]